MRLRPPPFALSLDFICWGRMSKKAHQSAFRRQATLIILGGGLIMAMTIMLGTMTLSRFDAVEAAWADHSKRATAIGDSLTNLQRHIGYGGFIHNFKNSILRLDLERYQEKLDRDIAGLTDDFKTLSTLLKNPDDLIYLGEVRMTFDEYISKYKILEKWIEDKKDPLKIDLLAKVSDDKALRALKFLADRAGQRAKTAEEKAQKAHSDAVYLLQTTGFLLISVVLIGMIMMVLFLRRVVVANEAILKTQERLDMLLDMSPDPMLSVTLDGTIVRTNKRAQEFFAYSSDEFADLAVENLMPARFREGHPQQRTGYFDKPAPRRMGERGTLKALTKDGREPDVEISLSHSGDGADRLATITVRDITEREKNRKALDRSRKRAEDALARQEQLQDGLVEAEKMAALGGLVAGIAHEINTPIGVALSSATHLEVETKKADDLYRSGEMTEEGLSDYFTTANQVAHMMTLNTQRASDLIQSFKQVAVDQTGDACRTFDMNDYIEEILLSLKPHFKQSSIKTHVNCPDHLSVYGHPGGVSQVLTNLITNSLRYAFDEGESGNISISVEATDDEVKLIYHDDGKGIEPDLQATVFDPFVTTGRSTGGSGLGLHIVYNIVTQTLKGTIALTSAPGQGATFTVTTPRNLSDSNQDVLS